MNDFVREKEMLQPLVQFLIKSGRVKVGTLMSEEFPWMGRWIDLAILTGGLRTASFELKLSNNFKAVEQAAKNSLAFDRSYAVTATMPSREVLDFAKAVGVGILYLRSDALNTHLAPSSIGPVEKGLRSRLISKMRNKAKPLCEDAYVR